jgi:hypothetical protein
MYICNEYGIVTFCFDLALHLYVAVLLRFADNKVTACFAKEMRKGQKKHQFIE